MDTLSDPFDCQTFHELCMDYRGAMMPLHAQAAYERLQAYCRAVSKPSLRRQRWRKRDLYEQLKPLRATGASWDAIGGAIGISGERCRQVWQLFGVDGAIEK